MNKEEIEIRRGWVTVTRDRQLERMAPNSRDDAIYASFLVVHHVRLPPLVGHRVTDDKSYPSTQLWQGHRLSKDLQPGHEHPH